jgi:hypothetical protein
MSRFLFVFIVAGLIGCGSKEPAQPKSVEPKASGVIHISVTDEHGVTRLVPVPEGEPLPFTPAPYKTPQALPNKGTMPAPSTAPPTIKMPGSNPPAVPPPATKSGAFE